MRPEQRLDRAERMILMSAKAGHRARREWREESRTQGEKINILIHSQIETADQIKSLAAGQAKLDKEMAELAKSHRLTEQALRAFINSFPKGRNGES